MDTSSSAFPPLPTSSVLGPSPGGFAKAGSGGKESARILHVSRFPFARDYHARKLTALDQKQPLNITYHNGEVLISGPISVNLIWYGKFTASQRGILSVFVVSLSASGEQKPCVFFLWKMAEKYYSQTKMAPPWLTLGYQILDEGYSLGKSLKNEEIITPAKSALTAW
ncbi:hypothetical protein MA16_Dca021399 [Dendrobium catenatum]|uniref:Uncharacterized protein n=1 Tax=Dendrobium catenatum TaxID=906689 RepID=A0A2I0X7A4_9ASPA|nr:hypothetical protein MA16_Dca021399 [Dendrobium catenatum]